MRRLQCNYCMTTVSQLHPTVVLQAAVLQVKSACTLATSKVLCFIFIRLLTKLEIKCFTFKAMQHRQDMSSWMFSLQNYLTSLLHTKTTHHVRCHYALFIALFSNCCTCIRWAVLIQTFFRFILCETRIHFVFFQFCLYCIHCVSKKVNHLMYVYN